MGFVALRALNMAGGVRPPGSPVPEAATWPNLNTWVRRGWVAFVVDGHEAEFARELKHNRVPQHLAPASKPYQLAAAARLMSFGTAPDTPMQEAAAEAEASSPAESIAAAPEMQATPKVRLDPPPGGARLPKKKG